MMKCQSNFSIVAFWKWFLLRFPNFWWNALLAILRTTYVTEWTCLALFYSVHVAYCDSSVWNVFAACDAAYPDIPLAEIWYNFAIYNESYTQKNLGFH